MEGWPLVSTPRLHLRPARMDDLLMIEAGVSDSRFPAELPLARMAQEAKLSAWLQRMTSDPESPVLWAATARDNDACIGTVALVREKSPATWWLAYWIDPDKWNKGFASEAIGALLNAAAQRQDYVQVVAAVACTNLASIRVLRRVGFAECSPDNVEQAVPAGHLTMQRLLRPRDA